MIRKPSRKVARLKRHGRIRNHVSGTSVKPRLAVFRSEKHIYAQLIDDTVGNTICASSTLDKGVAATLDKKTHNIEAAKAVGKDVAEKAAKKGIVNVVFDRGGYIYHGKIKALADAAREAGLKF